MRNSARAMKPAPSAQASFGLYDVHGHYLARAAMAGIAVVVSTHAVFTGPADLCRPGERSCVGDRNDLTAFPILSRHDHRDLALSNGFHRSLDPQDMVSSENSGGRKAYASEHPDVGGELVRFGTATVEQECPTARARRNPDEFGLIVIARFVRSDKVRTAKSVVGDLWRKHVEIHAIRACARRLAVVNR